MKLRKPKFELGQILADRDGDLVRVHKRWYDYDDMMHRYQVFMLKENPNYANPYTAKEDFFKEGPDLRIEAMWAGWIGETNGQTQT